MLATVACQALYQELSTEAEACELDRGARLVVQGLPGGSCISGAAVARNGTACACTAVILSVICPSLAPGRFEKGIDYYHQGKEIKA